MLPAPTVKKFPEKARVTEAALSVGASFHVVTVTFLGEVIGTVASI